LELRAIGGAQRDFPSFIRAGVSFWIQLRSTGYYRHNVLGYCIRTSSG
jgi:hypothetical protein